MAPRVERKLAAILAADVVGYSRLVGADEAGTIARLKALRKEFIEPLIAEYRGRVVKLMGDGALVEFASAVDAVECAVAIQHGVAEREAAEPEDRRIAVPHRHQRRRHHRRGRRHPGRRRQRRGAPRRPGRAGRHLRRPQRPQPGQGEARAPLRADGRAPGQEHRRAGHGLSGQPGHAGSRCTAEPSGPGSVGRRPRRRWSCSWCSAQAAHGTRCDHRRRHRTRPLRKAGWPQLRTSPRCRCPTSRRSSCCRSAI